MRKAVIIIARNEGDWPRKTAESFKAAMPDVEIVGVDDGGKNNWPKFVKVVKTKGAIGVGNCRRLGTESTKADLICFSDGHVNYIEGDIDRVWELAAEGYIVNPSVMSMETKKIHGCGRLHRLPEHKASYVKTEEGMVVGMIGSVYFMKRSVALDIVGPTPSHGYNEQIMTCAALTLGYKTYALPSLIFSHLFKKKFNNYSVTYGGQQRNRHLLDYWFFRSKRPQNIKLNELKYYNFIQQKRKISPVELRNKILEMNHKLTCHATDTSL